MALRARAAEADSSPSIACKEISFDMVVRFELPIDEIAAWCRSAQCLGQRIAKRAKAKGQYLYAAAQYCRLRTVVPVCMALVAVASATHAWSPTSTEQAEPSIDISAFVRYSRISVHAGDYPWLSAAQRSNYEPLADRIAPPQGYARAVVPHGSFADWLRHLPVLPDGSPVKSAGGRERMASDAPGLAAVVALEPNTESLKAAGMMVRLRAEYAWSSQRLQRLAFHFDSGQRMSWRAWMSGMRVLRGPEGLRFQTTGVAGGGRENFCAWVETQLHFTSVESLFDDTRGVRDGTIAPGDLFVANGRDGYALMVLDIATRDDGDVAVLLGTGGAPACSMYVPRSVDGEAWIRLGYDRRALLENEPLTLDLSTLRRWVN